MDLNIWFWIAASVFALLIMASVEGEKFRYTTPLFIIAIIALIYIGGSSLGEVWQTVKTDPMKALTAAGAYIGIGVAYAVLKWWFRLREIRQRLIDFRLDNQISAGTPLTGDERNEFLSYLIAGSLTSSLPPRISENKARFSFWLFYWPFSAPWTLIHNPVKAMFTFAYNALAGIFQSISDRMFRGLH